MRTKLITNFSIAWGAILANLIRSLLTALGIIFGVAAVIAMMAIGNGAQQEILEQIKLVGVNNIVITPIIEQVEEELTESFAQRKPKFSPGLTLLDANSIYQIVPGINKISPEIQLETFVIKNGIRRSAKLVGVDSSYFDITNFQFATGKNFNKEQMYRGDPVCIIGRGIQSRFFSQENPIGKRIKCGQHWLKIIGVLEQRIISAKSITNLGIRDYNMDVYTPLRSILIRYKNRASLTSAVMQRANQNNNNNNQEEEEEPKQSVNYHQLDRLVIQVSETDQLNNTSEIVARMLERRHYQVIDYEITIPELLLVEILAKINLRLMMKQFRII